MPVETACEACLKPTTGRDRCSRHPYAPLLRLDRSSDRDWYAIIRSKKRKTMIRVAAAGLLLAEVVAFFALAGHPGPLSAFFVLPMLGVILLNMVAILGWESIQGRLQPAPRTTAADTLLPPAPLTADTGEESRLLRNERRDRRTDRANVRDRQSKVTA